MVMANPMDAKMDVFFTTQVFNTAAVHEEPLVQLQTLEVLTSDFKVAIAPFNDLADVHEMWGDEEKQLQEMKDADDKETVPDRKFHKVLLRFRVKPVAVRPGVSSAAAAALAAAGQAWLFFLRGRLGFTDRSGTSHDVGLNLRFIIGDRDAVEEATRIVLDRSLLAAGEVDDEEEESPRDGAIVT